MKQIKDFNVSGLSYKDKDYFIFQRELDGVTYKISHFDIVKHCIKYTDTDFVQSLDWSKVVNRPSISCTISGKATGTGSVNLNSATPSLTISVSSLDLSSVTLGFVPVTQLGSKKVSLEWDSGTSSLLLIVDSSPNQSSKGPIALKSDLVWSNVANKPILSFSFTGMVSGGGSMNLMATNGVTIDITDITMKPIPWNMLTNKPTIKIGLTGSELKTIDFDAMQNNEEKVISLDAFHSELNILKFGKQNGMTAIYMLSAPNIDPSNPSTYDFGFIRGGEIDDKATIINTAGGNISRDLNSPMWETWNPRDPLNSLDWSYKNRIEMFPLLFSPYILSTRQRTDELVANDVDILGELKYNGIHVDLAKLLDIISDYIASH